MSSKRRPSPPPADGTSPVPWRGLTAAAGVVLLLHLLPRIPGAPLWGVDFLADLPGGRVVFGLLGAVLLLPATQRRIAGGVARVPWFRDERMSRAALLALSLAACAVFLAAAIAWRARTDLLGDGAVHVQILARAAEGDTPPHVNARLTYWLLGKLANAMTGVPLERVARTASWIAGAVYFAVGVSVARSLGRRPTERAVLLAFLLTPGYVLVFFGYVETYAVIFAGTLAYLGAGAEAARARLPWVVPAVLLGGILALHPIAGVFLPAWLVFSAHGATRRPAGAAARGVAGGPAGVAARGVAGGPARVAVRVATAWLLPLLVAWGLLALTGFSPAAYLASKQSSPLLPLVSQPGFLQAYRVGSWRHGVDLVNQVLLASPAVALGLLAIRWRKVLADADAAFLLGSATVPVLVTLVLNPEIGFFRDWDLLSLAAVPATLAVGVAFTRSVGGERALARAGVLVCGVAALHTAGWIATNASPSASERRFVALLRSAALSPHAQAYGWETWAEHVRGAGRMDEALDAYEEALRVDPSNHRYWNQAAILQFERGDTERALAGFREAKRLAPDYAQTWANEGSALLRSGDPEAARASLERALELDEALDVARLLLARACASLGDTQEAIALLREHVRRNPTATEPLLLLGNLYDSLEDVPAARECYERAVALDPDDYRAHYGLGVCHYNLGETELARRQFETVLRLRPDSPEAGIIRSRLGAR